MTLSLYVLRHAKAEESAPSGGDAARALRSRGRRAARNVGRLLSRLGEEPALVLSSSAVRARETAERAHAAGHWQAALEFEPALYIASVETEMRALRAVSGATPRVLLVGHEPGLSELINELARARIALPTAALARIDLELDTWSELAPRRGRLVWLVTPDVIDALRPSRAPGHPS